MCAVQLSTLVLFVVFEVHLEFDFSLNQEDGKVEIFGKIAVITVEADLSSEGGILDFPLHGHGHLKLNLCE